jgi:hypothetical protein
MTKAKRRKIRKQARTKAITRRTARQELRQYGVPLVPARVLRPADRTTDLTEQLTGMMVGTQRPDVVSMIPSAYRMLLVPELTSEGKVILDALDYANLVAGTKFVLPFKYKPAFRVVSFFSGGKAVWHFPNERSYQRQCQKWQVQQRTAEILAALDARASETAERLSGLVSTGFLFGDNQQ